MRHSRSRSRRRRNRRKIAGIVVRSVGFLVLIAAGVAACRWVNEPRFSLRSHRVAIESSVRIPSSFGTFPVTSRNRRVVYPYSIVPGGVASSEELQDAASHDPVVAEHYAGFDYKRARLIEVSQPKLVYLSYRKGDKVYWTKKQASLHKGEKLITDGHTTARTRCGNQVSVLPQVNTSPNEPTMAELDSPDAMASGMNRDIPSNFDSNLLAVDPGLPLGPGGSAPGNLFAGGPPPGGFIPMPIGGGITISGKPPQCPPGDTSEKCKENPPPPPPPAVPEPATLVLVASGAGLLWAKKRNQKNL